MRDILAFILAAYLTLWAICAGLYLAAYIRHYSRRKYPRQYAGQ